MPSPSTPKRAGTASGHVPRFRIRMARITATVVDGGLQTDGTQLWCSGGHLLDRALAAAHGEEGYRLFGMRLDASGIETRITWQGWACTAVILSCRLLRSQSIAALQLARPAGTEAARFGSAASAWRHAGTAAPSARCGHRTRLLGSATTIITASRTLATSSRAGITTGKVHWRQP